MLHVTFSNDLQRLAAALARRLSRREPATAARLIPEIVVVPNGNVAAYARLQLARHNGIAANLAMEHWQSFLALLLDRIPGKPRLLHRRALTALLAGIFADPGELERIGSEALLRYLHPPGGRIGDRDLHAYQLAMRLAGLFEDYALGRAEMIAAWRAGTGLLEDADGRTEEWQRTLWMKLFGSGGIREELEARAGHRWVLPSEIQDLVTQDADLPATLHVFGFSYMARGYLTLLRALASRMDIHLDAFLPVRPTKEKDGEPHLALESWGRPGLEFLEMVRGLTPDTEEALFGQEGAAGPPATFLARLQRDIEAGRTTAPEEGSASPGDRSLTLLACPSLQREVEVVAGKIWALLREEASTDRPALRFNDIAVIVADSARFGEYESHIRAIFQDMYDLPTSVSDVAPSSQGRALEAIELLLALPGGRFRRPELLKLLTHPSVLARFGRTDAEDWKRWCERTAIYFGADREDLAGLYVEKDLLTWEQGLKRLALGAFLAPGPGGDAPPFDLGGHSYVPEEVPPDELGSAALLSSLVRTLVAEARHARDARMPLADWARHFLHLVTTYLSHADDADELLLARARRELGALAELDLGGRPLPYRIASELAREALARIPGGRGHYLADGVVVSSLQPMRPIPFPVVFILGMGEGAFPAGDSLDALDLRRGARVPGDVTVRERDQYLFLEALVSTSRRLFLSWVSRNEQTGEMKNPSSSLEELLYIIQNSCTGDTDPRKLLIETHPLRRWEQDPPTGSVVLPPAAARELRLHELERSGLARLSRRERVEELRRDPSAAQRWLGLIPLPEAAGGRARTRMELTVRTLRQFLECPMQGWARAVLGLVEEEAHDVVSREDEPFTTDALARAILCREVFHEALASGARITAESLEVALGERADRAELAGRLPTGLFGDSARALLREFLEGWRTTLDESGVSGRFEPICFGRAGEGVRVRHFEAPVELDLVDARGEPLRIVLQGMTQPLDEGRTASLRLILREKDHLSDHLHAWIDHVMLSAAGLSGGPLRSEVLATRPIRKKPVFAALDRETAREYLARLVSDMLGRTHDYFLPIEAVARFHSGKGKVDLADCCEDIRLGANEKSASDRGPVPHPRTYAPPDEDEARRMVEARFALFLEGVEARGAEAE